jgi:hypothetical protein
VADVERWKMRMRPWVWFRAIVAALVVSVVLIAIFDRRPAVKVTTHHFISSPPIFAGADVFVEWKIIDLRHSQVTGQSCEGLVYVIWIDSAGRKHPPVPNRSFRVPVHEVREGYEQTFTAPRRVPEDMPLGDAIYMVAVDRWCNPLQELFPMREMLPEVRFVVEPKP